MYVHYGLIPCGVDAYQRMGENVPADCATALALSREGLERLGIGQLPYKLGGNPDGTSLDTSTWSTFAGRGEHSVSGGRLHTKLRYKGAVPISSATTSDLATEANWAEGGIVADQAQKFGYHEARLRLPQLPASGVDTAYWHGATDELGFGVVDGKVHVHDLHATILHLMGIDHERFTYRHQGLDFRLTGVEPAKVVKGIIA